MCIAIYKPAKTRTITDEEMESCKKNNPDGFGYSFVAYDPEEKENYVIVKKFMKYEEFLKEYRDDEGYHEHSPFLIHFRMTSAGKNSLENCHPFQINKYQSFMHNGTMFSPPVGEARSDTNLFNEHILKELPEGWEKNPGIEVLIEKFIGVGKIVVLNADFSYQIFGEERGHWHDGIWWSNFDYKTFRRGQVFYNDWYGKNWNSQTVIANDTKESVEDPRHKVIKRTTYFKDNIQYTKLKYADGSVVDFPSYRTDNLGNVLDTEPKQLDPPKDEKFTGEEGLIGMNDTPPERQKFECSFCGNPYNIMSLHPYTWGSAEYELCDDCYGDFDKLCMM